MVSNLVNLNKIHRHDLEGWLEVGIDLPSAWIKEHFSSKFKATGIDSAVLSFTTYSTAKHECRTFKASDELLDLILTWSPGSLAGASAEPVVNLFDGAPYSVQAPKQWEQGTFSSKIIRGAVKCFQSCPFNYDGVVAHLKAWEQRVRHCTTAKERGHLSRAQGNDCACAMRLLAGCKPNGDGIAHYQPEYRTSYTGRIIEVGGGAQSCSRAMKAAMFGGVPGLRNYDLKRAQAFILLQELEDAGLPRDWVERYLSEPDANDKRAAAIGISKEAYKTCLYATIMGATHTRHWDRRENRIYDRLVVECQSDEGAAKALAARVYDALAPLKTEVVAWHEHLLGSERCRHVDPTYKKVRTLRNACDQHFRLEGARADKLARKAAAFVLQGQEAAFIHRLTALGTTTGFVPVNNQHDGLVVVGEISMPTVGAAATSAGLRYATLEPKSFV